MVVRVDARAPMVPVHPRSVWATEERLANGLLSLRSLVTLLRGLEILLWCGRSATAPRSGHGVSRPLWVRLRAARDRP